MEGMKDEMKYNELALNIWWSLKILRPPAKTSGVRSCVLTFPFGAKEFVEIPRTLWYLNSP